MSSSVSFQDVTTITLTEADLTEKKCGKSLTSPKRKILGSGGLKWWIKWYPAGETAADKGHVSVFLWVDKYVTAKFTIAVDTSSIIATLTHEFPDPSKGQGWPRFASHDMIRPVFRDGKLNITCSVEFNVKPPKPIVTVKDTITFMLNESDLTEKKVGEDIETPGRNIPYFNGFQWWIEYYPAGHEEDNKGYVSVFLVVNKPVTAKFKFAVDGSSISSTINRDLTDESDYGPTQFASHEELRPLFCDGKVYITCNVEFEVPDPHSPAMPCFYAVSAHVPTDYTLEVGNKKVEVHREYLSLISPIFCSMLSGNSRSRKMKIPNMDYDAVNAAIDFCYGRELHDKSAETYYGILRFANKYEMVDVAAEVERYLTLHLSVDSVSTLLRSTYDNGNDLCLNKCIQFFKDNETDVKKNKEFLKLPSAVVIHALKTAFELNTDFEVLQYARRHDYEFVIDEIEKRILTSMTLDDFCPTVSYAWDNNRDDMKKACAKFCAKNQSEVMKLSDFCTLPPEVIGGVIKLAFDLKREMP